MNRAKKILFLPVGDENSTPVCLCDFCGKPTRVIDKRNRTDVVARRRECTACGERFSTYEVDQKKMKAMKRKIREYENLKEEIRRVI
jgi:transcriptional regulator NrdR family protein